MKSRPLLATLSLTVFNVSATVTVPNTFTSGTAISAAQMNANFTTLETYINGMSGPLPGGGTLGQILRHNGSNLIWSTALSTLNGDSSETQSLGFGHTGVSPGWTALGGGTHTLNIPLASSAAVTAGLISNADYNNFNGKFNTSGGTLTGNLSIGNTGPLLNFTGGGVAARIGTTSLPLIFDTLGAERVRIDSSGNVGIGTTNPTSRLDVHSSSTNLGAGYSVAQITGSLGSTSSNQFGLKINISNDQSGSGSLALVHGDISNYPTSPGSRFIVMKDHGLPKFEVNTDGYFQTGGQAFMAVSSLPTSVTCATTPDITVPTGFASVTLGTADFGSVGVSNHNADSLTLSGLVEIIIDVPDVPSGFVDNRLYVLSNGSDHVPLIPGRNVKRLSGSGWRFWVGCKSAGTGSISITHANTVFGIRPFH
jgi:hypothetical protein